MAQYFKDVFNIAPGLGRALDDPRVAEAQQQQALNLQAKAQRENVRQNLFANMLAQQQAMLQADQISSQGALENRRLNMQADQFQQQLSASSQEAAAQRAFQDAMLTRQLDASSRESALSRQFSGQQSALDRAMQQQNADRAFRSTQADQALRTQSYLDSRADRAQDVSFRNQSYADSRTDRAGDVAFRNQGYLDSRSDRAGDVAFRNQSYLDSRSDNAFQQLMAQQQFGLQQDQFGLQQQQFNFQQGQYADAQRQALQEAGAPIIQELMAGLEPTMFYGSGKGLSDKQIADLEKLLIVRPELAPVISQAFQRADDFYRGQIENGSNKILGKETPSSGPARDRMLDSLMYLQGLGGRNTQSPFFQVLQDQAQAPLTSPASRNVDTATPFFADQTARGKTLLNELARLLGE